MGDVLDLADRLWRGEADIADHHPFRVMNTEAEEVADGVAFVPSFANVSAVATEDGLVLVDTGERGRSAKRAHRRCDTGPTSDSTPRSTRTGTSTTSSAFPSSRQRPSENGMAGATRHRPRGIAATLRPLHPHRGLQLDHQPAPIQGARPAVANRVPLSRTRRTAITTRSTSAARASSCTTRAARPTTTRGRGSPSARFSAAATSSSGRRPTPVTRRRCSATRRNGLTRLRVMADDGRRGPAAGPRAADHRQRPDHPGPHRRRRPARLPPRRDRWR